MSDQSPFGSFLGIQRKKRGWTQRQVSFKLRDFGAHVGRRTVSNYETGKQIPDKVTLRAFAKLYGREVHELAALVTASMHDLSSERIERLLELDPPTEALGEDPVIDEEEAREERPTAAKDTGGPPTRRLAVLGWIGLVVLAALAAIIGLLKATSSSPNAVRLVDGRLTAFCDVHRLWSVNLPGISEGRVPPQLHDVDRDGRNDVLVAYNPARPATETGRVICYDHRGKLRWEVSLGRPQTIRGRTFTPYYVLFLLRWIETPQATYLLAVALHQRWYPTQVLLLDPATGRTISEYWHPGYLQLSTTYDLLGDGTVEVILGGINNPDLGPGHAVIVVLDLPFGEPTGHDNLFGRENSLERAYLVFPRPDLLDVYTELAAVDVLELTPDGRLVAGVGTGEKVLLFYEFDRTLTVTDIRPSDTLISTHNQLAEEGHFERYSPAELLEWRKVRLFPTAPDANSPKIRNLFKDP